MLSRIASSIVLVDGDMPHDAGVENQTHRKVLVLGCGAVIIIGAGSYTIYKYRHGIQAFFNRLYESASQYMRVCLQMDTSDSAAPAPQEEVNNETGANDNAATGETQRNAHGDDVADGEDNDGAIPFQVDGYNLSFAGDLSFPFAPFQQVDGGGTRRRRQTLYNIDPSIIDVTPEDQGGEVKTAPAQDKSDETPQLIDGGAAEETNAKASNDSKEKKDESQQQMGGEDSDD